MKTFLLFLLPILASCQVQFNINKFITKGASAGIGYDIPINKKSFICFDLYYERLKDKKYLSLKSSYLYSFGDFNAELGIKNKALINDLPYKKYDLSLCSGIRFKIFSNLFFTSEYSFSIFTQKAIFLDQNGDPAYKFINRDNGFSFGILCKIK